MWIVWGGVVALLNEMELKSSIYKRNAYIFAGSWYLFLLLYASKIGGWIVLIFGFIELIVLILCVVGICVESKKLASNRIPTRRMHSTLSR